MYEYESVRRMGYDGGAVFVPVCEKCGRFVTPDDDIKVNEITGLTKETNANCSRCGRTHMIFEGFIE